MAEEKKPSFPLLPVAHWWSLREKFKQSIPGVVTDNYLATALQTKAASARINILPYLKTLGLINEEGKTQDLAKKWRDDAQYKDVCQKIRSNIYPDELISAVPNPSEDRNSVETYFANNTGGGVSLVRRMAAFYILLSEADASKKPEKKPMKQQDKPKQKLPVKSPVKGGQVKKETQPQTSDTPGDLLPPSININLEIHISSDSTSDQIEKIFESMAKHIYKR